jgi:hypothetical protein
MVCPYCQFEYTPDQPCFCQPPHEGKTEDPSKAVVIRSASDGEPIFWNTARGNRLD